MVYYIFISLQVQRTVIVIQLERKAKKMLFVLVWTIKQKLHFQYEERRRKNKPDQKTKTLQKFWIKRRYSFDSFGASDEKRNPLLVDINRYTDLFSKAHKQCSWRILGILGWVAVPFSRGSSQPGSSALQTGCLPFEPPGKPSQRILLCNSAILFF